MPEHDGISEYLKAGLHRLRDAEELLQEPSIILKESGADTRHLRGAVYLAGYAVECVLKAYLIQLGPPRNAKTVATSSSGKTNDISSMPTSFCSDTGIQPIAEQPSRSIPIPNE